MSATTHGNRGRVQSPETRAKIAAALIGRKFSPEALERLHASRRGVALTPEHKAKLLAANKRVFTPEMIDTVQECRSRSMGQEATAQAVGVSRRVLVAWLRENMPSTIAPGARDRFTKYSAETLAAREALIREHYPVGMPKAHLIDLCNKIPGRTITEHALEQMLVRLQVHRNPGIVRRTDAAFIVWTDERLALLRHLRGVEGMDWVGIAARVSELPGPRVEKDAARRQCSKAGIRLPAPAKVSGPKPKRIRVRAPVVRKQRLPAPVPIPVRPKQVTGGLFNYAKAVEQPRRYTPPTEPVILPPPGDDGVIEADLMTWFAWAHQNGAPWFDGSNMPNLSRARVERGMAPGVIIG